MTSRRILISLAALLVAPTIACAGAPADDPTTTTKDANPASSQPPAAPLATPQPADFVIEVVVLRKQCFGSAGCNLTYQIKPSYSGATLTADQAFTVIYSITGDESGELTGSFTLRGDQAEYASEETMGTASSKVVPTAKVTQVLPN